MICSDMPERISRRYVTGWIAVSVLSIEAFMRRGRWATCECQRGVGWRYSGTEATPVLLPGEMERGSSSIQDIPPGEKHNRFLCDMGDIWGPSWLSLQREG